MHDRYSSCFSRANLRDACPGYWRDSQLWHVQSSNMQRETPKKICHDGESCFLCKRTFSVAKEKIRVFGKSSFDISSLIHRALNVDLTVYVDREQLAICRTQCYSRIVRYKNAVQKVEEIGGEIKRNFGGDFPFRVKRMAKDHFNTSEAKKCLDFGDTPSTASPGTPTNLHVGETSAEINIDPGRGIGLSPIPFAGFAPTQSFVPVFVQSSSQYLVQKAFPGFSPGFASTPRISRLNNKNQSQETSLQESSKETKVHLTVVYPSKTIRKELKDDYASLGKAIVHGSHQRIARAVLKNETLKKFIVEKILQLMTIQLNELCSRRNPSILRATTKEDIKEFDFKNLSFEWKERAPIFYAFLMTCASSQKQNNLEWLPSVSVAGSILLKQRNPHMNGCATILGLLMKSRSLEVSLLIVTGIYYNAEPFHYLTCKLICFLSKLATWTTAVSYFEVLVILTFHLGPQQESSYI